MQQRVDKVKAPILCLVGAPATGGLLPDLTIILDLPTAIARGRVGAARDRMEDRSAHFHDRVRDGFAEASRTYPAMIRTIDATADPDAVAGSIETEVAHALAIDPRS